MSEEALVGIKEDLKYESLNSVEARLQSIFRVFAVAQCRSNAPEVVLNALTDVLHISVDLIKCDQDVTVNLVSECFRQLRNACAGQKAVQNKLSSSTTLLEDAAKILETIHELPSEQCSSCLQTGIQFLGNLVVKNEENQLIVWKKFSVLLMQFLQNDNEKVSNFSSMVIYNIILGCTQISREIDAVTLEIMIERATQGCEFSLFTVDLLVRTKGYIQSVYEKLGNKQKLFVLETLFEDVGCKIGETDDSAKLPKIHSSTILFLSDQFKRRSFFILQTVEDYVNEIEPMEVAKLLEVIASASGKSPYLDELQKDKSLLIDCTFLLKSIHSLGMESDNHFTMIQRLSELNLKGKDTVLQQHPAFGFKVNLVRLLGNLCWKHNVNQQQVLELDGTQLLLDCCKIDARNPLLMQWAILAIRNMCEQNKECQEVIAGMTKMGEVDAETLNHVGLTLHNGPDGGIGIMPLPH